MSSILSCALLALFNSLWFPDILFICQIMTAFSKWDFYYVVPNMNINLNLDYVSSGELNVFQWHCLHEGSTESLLQAVPHLVNPRSKTGNLFPAWHKYWVYNQTDLYLWTAIPYYNMKVCRHAHIHPWKVVWISPMFKRQAVTAEK